MFALQETFPVRSGTATQFDMPLSSWMSTIFSSNINDGWVSVGTGLQNRYFQHIMGDYGSEISPELANKLYGIPDGPLPLRWEKPVNNQAAMLQHEARKAELKRLALIESATHSPFSIKGAGTLAMTLAASVAHPIDMAMALFPAVGSSTKARIFAKTGAAAWRVRMMSGLITSEERVAKMVKRFPRVTSSIIDASVGESVLQIPNFILAARESGIYQSIDDYTQNVAMAGLTGGAFRGILEGMLKSLPWARDMYLRFSPAEREAAATKALNDKLFDNPIRVSDIAVLSDDLVNERVRMDLDFERYKADLRTREPDAAADLHNAALARLEREGNLGKVNTKDLQFIAKEMLKDPVQPDNIQQTLLRDLDHLLEGLRATGNQKDAPKVLRAMADALGLVHDNSTKSFPSHWRALMSEGKPGGVPTKDMAWLVSSKGDLYGVHKVTAKETMYYQALGHVVELREKMEKLKTEGSSQFAKAHQEFLAASQALTELTKLKENIPDMFRSERRRSVHEAIHGERLKTLVENERQKRIEAHMRTKQQELTDATTRRNKALADLQKEGRLISKELVAKFQFSEGPSAANAAILETDVKAIADNLQIEEKILNDAMNGKSDTASELEINAKREAAGQQPIDFALLRQAAKENSYMPQEAAVQAGANCILHNAI